MIDSQWLKSVYQEVENSAYLGNANDINQTESSGNFLKHITNESRETFLQQIPLKNREWKVCKLMATAVEELGVGNCQEMVSLLYCKLVQKRDIPKKQRDSIKIVHANYKKEFKKDPHCFLVIGEQKKGKILWGKPGFLLDPWSKRFLSFEDVSSDNEMKKEYIDCVESHTLSHPLPQGKEGEQDFLRDFFQRFERTPMPLDFLVSKNDFSNFPYKVNGHSFSFCIETEKALSYLFACLERAPRDKFLILVRIMEALISTIPIENCEQLLLDRFSMNWSGFFLSRRLFKVEREKSLFYAIEAYQNADNEFCKQNAFKLLKILGKEESRNKKIVEAGISLA